MNCYKIILTVVLISILNTVKANMASPYIDGTYGSSVITSKDINILSENITIITDKNFKTARYIVEYKIQSAGYGTILPLLFYAKDYKDSFYVWMDNQKVSLLNISEKYYSDSSFKSFADNMVNTENGNMRLEFGKNESRTIKLDELKYFETLVSKGAHTIRVEYTANVWLDKSDWIKEYSFRYSLSPAKLWKSFGTLTVNIKQQDSLRNITTNLGTPIENKIQETNSWIFKKLPADYITINYMHKPSAFTSSLMALSPEGIAIALWILLAIVHALFIINNRRKNKQQGFFTPLLLGNLIIPVVVLFALLFAYYLIDYLLGSEASNTQGYGLILVLMFLGPVFVGTYWVAMWILDLIFKYKYKKRNA